MRNPSQERNHKEITFHRNLPAKTTFLATFIKQNHAASTTLCEAKSCKKQTDKHFSAARRGNLPDLVPLPGHPARFSPSLWRLWWCEAWCHRSPLFSLAFLAFVLFSARILQEFCEGRCIQWRVLVQKGRPTHFMQPLFQKNLVSLRPRYSYVRNLATKASKSKSFVQTGAVNHHFALEAP